MAEQTTEPFFFGLIAKIVHSDRPDDSVRHMLRELLNEPTLNSLRARRSTPAPIDGTCCCGGLITSAAAVHGSDVCKDEPPTYDTLEKKARVYAEGTRWGAHLLRWALGEIDRLRSLAPAPAPIEKIAEELDALRRDIYTARIASNTAIFNAESAIARIVRHFTDDKKDASNV